ncbi:MAG: bifunctional adenosylcobinamide kinase/adenosylcobinamide-phosphate guanylyltransferase [Halioglobus sp.]|nr:bifunctional adenosylcobinamide kinase/adenosylcobinamide-phosphate guanylyltransferase [Halioglobus sp.]
MAITFIVGGARSGKSQFAERRALMLAKRQPRPVYYIATATAGDTEMQQRIDHHQQRRPDDWVLSEEPIYLARAITDTAYNAIVLVDCLTLWLNNLLLQFDQELLLAEKEKLLTSLNQISCDGLKEIILVSNETGLGIVPVGELSRRFIDESGWLHQTIAQQADNVIFTVAGLPQVLKGNS